MGIEVHIQTKQIFYSHFFPRIFSMNIYIGNLNYRTTEETVRSLFEEYGEVITVKLIKDRETGRKKGFGFVEMESEDEATAAIDALNDQELEGRNIKVNKAKEREPRQPGM